ncbi:hypothetical protein LFX25_07195 [Leptospira sp. FAT2]|uniref:Gfo/Idh/MocA family oxidoreductase n=1 Tax=Leptospira sanjuanensis TaxID=2879643 RepID=UPI001EE98ABE|nr:Gfo/Idh/MocA family oxidoreductase [Leptospira sanjuanensis]MCG6167607.1 hypothetical protein [Leptospira sanjuanensis]MCG6193026.1 hypothetical protein [Leptospira sanjuanensis]
MNEFQDEIILIGTGYMAREYAKVLKAQNRKFYVVGRSVKSCDSFTKETGVIAFSGEIANFDFSGKKISKAVIAVNEDQLFNVTRTCIDIGIKSILLEKPGSLYLSNLIELSEHAESAKTDIYIAYNRRFYASTLKAIDIIQTSGGVLSFNFEFTEWKNKVENFGFSKEILASWFIVNSSHLVDLSFFLCGDPEIFNSYKVSHIDWHPAGSIFSGAGRTKNNALFTYSANWQSAGSWALEINTQKERLIFKPVEKLKFQKIDSREVEEYQLEDELDLLYKPGLFRQTYFFLINKKKDFCMLKDQIERFGIYNKILNP